VCSRDPLLIPAIAFASGIALAAVVDISAAQAAVALAVCTGAAVLSRYRRYYLAVACLCAGMLVLGTQSPGAPPELDAASGETVLLTGCITEPPSFSDGKEQFVLDLEHNARVRVTKYLREGEPPPNLEYGQMIEVQAKTRQPRNFGNPGAFDYRGYLARRHIYWTASMTSGTDAEVLPGNCGSAVVAYLYRLRTTLLARIEQSYPSQPFTVAMLQALLIGESARFERVWADQFRRTGTYHAIVISGLHVTVIAAVVLAFLRLLPFDGNTLRIVAALVVWIYAGMCGWQAPVVRAAGGFTLYAIGRFYYRKSRLLNLLAALTFVFLGFDALQLTEASFQLTFLSVLALGALAAPAVEATTAPLRYGLSDLADSSKDMHIPPRIAQFRVEMRLLAETLCLWLHLPPAAGVWVIRIALWPAFFAWETVLISAAVQLGLALPMIVYFHRLSLSGLSANLVVTPLLTAAVPVSLAALLTGWGWLLGLTSWMVDVSLRVASWHASWEPNWRIPDPPLWLAASFLATLVLLAVYRRPLMLALSLAVLGIIVAHPFPPAGTNQQLELTMIDVGQGESLLIGFPDGRWMLIDGGGIPVFGNRPKPKMDIGEDVVSSYLFTRAIRHINIIASTHQHDDHSAGLSAIIDNFHPTELWAGATPGGSNWDSLRSRVPSVRNLRAGDAFDVGEVHIDVLAPPRHYQPKQAATNNDSLVLRLNYGEHSFLLTGDVERAIEQSLMGLTKVNVLKVAHHGSRTSTSDAFLDAVKPEFAIISAGKDNLFRHPHADVIERLRQHHAAIYRSDELGMVTIRSDGRRFTVDSDRWRNVRSRLPVSAHW